MKSTIKIAHRLILILVISWQSPLFAAFQSCSKLGADCDTQKTITLSDPNNLLPEDVKQFLPSEPRTVPVKRIHSRHRRFIAPGAAWQLKVCKKWKMLLSSVYLRRENIDKDMFE